MLKNDRTRCLFFGLNELVVATFSANCLPISGARFSRYGVPNFLATKKDRLGSFWAPQPVFSVTYSSVYTSDSNSV